MIGKTFVIMVNRTNNDSKNNNNDNNNNNSNNVPEWPVIARMVEEV